MSDTVTLKHGTFKPRKKVVHFYEGHLFAENGLLTIPLSKPLWITSAWYDGYNLTPEGKRLWTTRALNDYVAALQTTKSAKEENESSDSRRQPATEDGVRQSKPRSRKSVSK